MSNLSKNTTLPASNTIIQHIDNNTVVTEKPKAKRGRRSKKEIAEMKEKEEQEKLNNLNNPSLEEEKPLPKKRGRKPKGGKIIHEERSSAAKQIRRIEKLCQRSVRRMP